MKFNNQQILTTVLLLLFKGVMAQDSGKISNTGNVLYNSKQEPVLISTSSPAQTNPLTWLRNQLQLSSDEGTQLIREQKDELGFTHYRYQFYYKNYLVEHKTYYVHVKDGVVKSANGDYVKLNHVDASIAINEAAALTSAKADVNARTYKWEVQGEEKRLQQETGDSSATFFPKGELMFTSIAGNYQLCYRFNLYAHEPAGRYFVYVNASNGKVVKKESALHHVDVKGIGNTGFYGMQEITTEQTNNGYRLRETGRGKGIETYTLNGGTSFEQGADITDADNHWDSLPGNLINGVQAHFGTASTYDYYAHVHNRNSIDGNGFKLLSYVLYDAPQERTNAFWDGQRMVYTSPAANSLAVTIIDVVGHEITHGLSQFTANFSRSGEAASINESCSDIFGALIERYKFPDIQDSVNFVTGEQIVAGGARSLINPNATNCPDTYGGQHWDESGQSFHNNGTVHSHWFYLLSRGKSGVNDKNDTFEVNGLGIEKAAKIMYRALTNYYTSDMTFEQARMYTIEAAKDLYGSCSAEMVETTNAWYAVGVGNEYKDTFNVQFSYKEVPCSYPAKINFTNNSTNATNLAWSFGDGATSSLGNPSHEFAASGQYQVTLTAKSCANTNEEKSKSVTIKVDNENRCDEIVMQKSGKLASANCKGVVYDDGKDTIYSNNTNGYVVLSPSNNTGFNLTFDVFEMGAFQDQVIIYEGDGITGNTLYTYSIFSPAPKTIKIEHPVITIQQKTDDTSFDGAPNGGFKIYWECIQSTGLPKESIGVPAVQVYPNPATTELTIHLDGELINSETKLTLYNTIGERVLEQKLTLPETRVNLQMLTPGVYHYEIKEKSFVSSNKLIIY